MWNCDLHLTIVEVGQIPQFEDVLDVDGDEKALIRNEGDMTNLIIMSIVDLLLVSLQGKDLNYPRASAHS